VIIVGILFFLIVVYCLGSFVFIGHWHRKYVKLVDKPWREALIREDWDECDRWHDVSTFHLKVNILNPVNWVRYWNWKPQ
jgi:hypothetical protein